MHRPSATRSSHLKRESVLISLTPHGREMPHLQPVFYGRIIVLAKVLLRDVRRSLQVNNTCKKLISAHNSSLKTQSGLPALTFNLSHEWRKYSDH